jgi:hypothetical protein
MVIFDFLCRRKIKAQYYFNEKDRQLDMPSIGVQLSKSELSADVKAQIGQVKSHNKITIPEGGDVTELAKLDMMQYQLANTINTLNGKSKQEKTEKYVELLLQMFRIDTEKNTKKGSEEELSKENIEKKEDIIQDKNCFDCLNLKTFLEEREFRSLFLPNNLCEEGTLLWPMNVQDNVTYIHSAQFQLAKLFVLAGWKLKVIIGDCGHNSSKGRDARDGFKKAIESFFSKNKLSSDSYKITLLSQYFIRNQESDIEIDQIELLEEFHSISDKVQWKDYKNEILKEYDDETRYKIENRKILNNIQPLLVWSVVASINQYNVKNNAGKVIVVAGADELKQWERIVDTHRRNNLGVIFIQELKTADGKTMNQSEIKITDKIMLQEKINNNENLAKWLFLHFIELPKYHTHIQQLPFCNISKNKCKEYNDNCIKCLFENENYREIEFDKNEYVKYIYPLINSAN